MSLDLSNDANSFKTWINQRYAAYQGARGQTGCGQREGGVDLVWAVWGGGDEGGGGVETPDAHSLSRVADDLRLDYSRYRS